MVTNYDKSGKVIPDMTAVKLNLDDRPIVKEEIRKIIERKGAA